MKTKIIDYDLGECGKFQYAQWLHPLEQPKNFTQDGVKLWPSMKDKPIAIDIGARDEIVVDYLSLLARE